MFKTFLKDFLIAIITYGFVFFIFGLWYLAAQSTTLLVIIVAAFVVAVSYQTSKSINEDFVKQHKVELKNIVDRHGQELKNVENELAGALQEKEFAEKEEGLWKATLIERSAGFPTLVAMIQEYEKLRDESLANMLVVKSHPARKSSEIIREEAGRRREADFQRKTTQAIINYYESIAPFLLDFKNDIVGIENEEVFREYGEEEEQDPVTNYLAKEEYRKLSPKERNQLALDRFWRRPKSRWLLGRLYERYVGYLYEKDGYEVEYTGIFKGYEDLGRDLICQKGNDFIVIQCKNWAKFKTIYEKHIFQFFGTVFQYKDSNQSRRVRAIFYTTTQLSELARRFAGELNIELQENFRFDQSYPSIKCNISRVDNEKIYHLPFDQQYDNTKIEIDRGEFYCSTTEEAEGAGFRRAFRWHGNQAGDI